MDRTDPNPTPETTPTVQRARRAAKWLVVGAGAFAVLLGWTSWQAFARDSQPPALAAVEGGTGILPVDSPDPPSRPGVAWPTPAEQESPAFADAVEDAQGGAGVPPAENVDSDLPQPDSPEHADASTPPRAAEVHPSQTRDAQLIVDGEVWTGPTFDGRPIRPVRTVTMRTTAYSPDEQSCGIWADGITASGMSVWTNGMKLAAADPSLPFGTILTVPGYNDNHPIPVLDRGGAIKGNRLDLLYPTHDIALQWGVQELEVVVWEYADE